MNNKNTLMGLYEAATHADNNHVLFNKLSELFVYDKVSGDVLHKFGKSRKAKAGQVAGRFLKIAKSRRTKTKVYGNIKYVTINRDKFKQSVIVWILVNKNVPDFFPVEINGDKADNRIENLKLGKKPIGTKYKNIT